MVTSYIPHYQYYVVTVIHSGAVYRVPTGVPIVNSVVLSTFVESPNCQVNTSILKTPIIITLQHDVRYGLIHVCLSNTGNHCRY